MHEIIQPIPYFFIIGEICDVRVSLSHSASFLVTEVALEATESKRWHKFLLSKINNLIVLPSTLLYIVKYFWLLNVLNDAFFFDFFSVISVFYFIVSCKTFAAISFSSTTHTGVLLLRLPH